MTKEPQTLTVVAVGDIFPGRNLGKSILKTGVETYVEKLKQLFVDCDVVVGNLECPITETDRRCQGQLYNLKISRELAPLLQVFDAVSLANNHILDYNKAGLLDTLETLKDLNILFCGAGCNQHEAAEPCIIQKNNFSIGMFAFTDRNWYPSTFETAGTNIWRNDSQKKIKACRKDVDFIITHQHQGYEFIDYPGPEEFTSARNLIKAGSDMVLGHHSHTLFGIKKIDQVPVAFGLGNFIFDAVNRRHIKYGTRRGMIKFTLSAHDVHSWQFIPLISNENGWPVLPDSETAEKIKTHFTKLSDELQDETRAVKKFKKQAGRIMLIHALQSLCLLFKQEGPVAVYKRLRRLRWVDYMVVFSALLRPFRKLFVKEKETEHEIK